MEEIYNMLMSAIEPDLLTDNLSTLEEKHGNENADERRERMQRYQAALALYDERFTELMTRWKNDIVSARDALIAVSKHA